jgi:hypothetical protein
MSVCLLSTSSIRLLSHLGLCVLVGVPGAVIRQLIRVLLAHRATRDLALACCRIKHRRSPETELSVVLEEHTRWGGEIAEAEMGRRILNRQETGVQLPRAFEHGEAQDAALLGAVGSDNGA